MVLGASGGFRAKLRTEDQLHPEFGAVTWSRASDLRVHRAGIVRLHRVFRGRAPPPNRDVLEKSDSGQDKANKKNKSQGLNVFCEKVHNSFDELVLFLRNRRGRLDTHRPAKSEWG